MLARILALVLLGFALVSIDTQVVRAQLPHVGPMFTGGLGFVRGDVPTGIESKAQFAFTAGIIGELRLDEELRAGFGVLYEARSRQVTPTSDSSSFIKNTVDLGYLSFHPMIGYSIARAGLGIRLPMSGANIYESRDTAINSSIETSSLKTVIDLRAGVSIPLVDTDEGSFNFVVMGTYSLGDAFTYKPLDIGNWATGDMSVQAGFTYLIDLSKLE